MRERRDSLIDDMKWVFGNFQLCKEYAGQWIAVSNRQVVASGKTYEEVTDQTRTLGLNVYRVIFSIPPQSDVKVGRAFG